MQATIFYINSQLHSNAVSLAAKPREELTEYVRRFRSLVSEVRDVFPSAVSITGDLLTHLSIPCEVIARLNPDTGEQIVNERCEPQWDIRYLIVDARRLPERIIFAMQRAVTN